MAIEKSYYTNGEGSSAGDPLVVEVENPDAVTVAADGMEMRMEFDDEPQTPGHYDTLVDYMDEGELGTLGSELVGLYKADHESRHKWEESYI